MNKAKASKIEKSGYILCESCESNKIRILSMWKKKREPMVYAECKDCSLTFDTPEPVLSKELIKREIEGRILTLQYDKERLSINPYMVKELGLLKAQVV